MKHTGLSTWKNINYLGDSEKIQIPCCWPNNKGAIDFVVHHRNCLTKYYPPMPPRRDKKNYTRKSHIWADPCSRDLLRWEKTQRTCLSRPMSSWPVFKFSFLLFSFPLSSFSTFNNLQKIIWKLQKYNFDFLIDHKMFVDWKDVHNFVKNVCLFKKVQNFENKCWWNWTKV